MRHIFAAATLLLAAVLPAAAQEVTVSHGAAMHGDLKYGPGFTHFDYSNPDAPKGGEVRLSAIGSFDNLNPFILKGQSAAGLGQVFETLMTGSEDEAFSEYGLIAESIEMPGDRSWVAFTLRPEARWHDGTPITIDDVLFSLDALKTRGHPFYRAYFRDALEAEEVGERKVKFTFADGLNRELPLIMGQMPILSKAYFTANDFEKTTLEPPLGSGPYRVERVDAGRSITYRRVEDYWGAELPVRRGQNNFDVIRYDYYRDPTVAMEAFKAHEYDFRQENTAKVWATAYEGPAFDQDLIVREEIGHSIPTGMQGFFFNTRLAKFADPRVRQALAYAFDFEWTNKNLFHGAYTRTASYFSNSELASSGLPDAAELALLEPFRGQVPPEVFGETYAPPATDGSGNARRNLGTALKLLGEAGWTVQPDFSVVRREISILDKRWYLAVLVVSLLIMIALATWTYRVKANRSTGNPHRDMGSQLRMVWTVAPIAFLIVVVVPWLFPQESELRVPNEHAGKIVGPEGEAMEIEVLIVSPQFERIIAPMVKNLEKLGVVAKIRLVDSAQYEKRLEDFDFDMITGVIGQSLSPGNEQNNFWTSVAADTPGSRNFAGVNDPVVDALVEKVIAAPDRGSLIAATRALDRVLLWGHYVIPHWHIQHFRAAYWNKFTRPAVTPKYSLGFDSWWIDPAREERLAEREKSAEGQ